LFSLRIKRKQLRVIERLLTRQKTAVKDLLEIMKTDPVPARRFDVVKLKGYDNIYRIRVGRLRIVYSVDWGGRGIDIQFVGYRGKAYRP